MLIATDAAAIEWRVAAQVSGDAIAIKEISEGADTHTLNQHAFNLPDRLTAKKYLFRTLYNRGKGYAFSQDPEFTHVSSSVKFWDEVGRKFYKDKYVGIDRFYDKNLKLVGSGKPIVGITGREWFLEPYTNFKGELELPVTKVVNFEVQGTAADIMMLARISFRNRMHKLPQASLVKLVSTVHDSVTVDAPAECIMPVAKMFNDVFADLPKNIEKIFGYKWTVPLACETKYGKNMRNMSKVV